MSDVFTDPLAWSRSMVGTLPRFCLFSLFFVCLIWFALFTASTPDMHGAAWGLGFFISAYQVMFLYALRRLAVSLRSQQVEAVRA